MKTPRKDWETLVSTARNDRPHIVNERSILEAYRAEKLRPPPSWLTELGNLLGTPKRELRFCLGGLAALCAALLLGLNGLAQLQAESWVALFAGFGGLAS